MARKSVIPLTVASEFPEPFRTYWLDDEERLDRPTYEFFLVDGELYIGEGNTGVLHHWTQDCCAGINCFMDDQGIKERRDLPYVFRDGTYLVEVLSTDSYETSVRHPVTGELDVVHSG